MHPAGRPLPAKASAISLSTSSRRGRIFYGWWLLAAAVVCMAIVSGVSFWSMGAYITPLEEEFGWSRTLLQTGISVSLLISGLGSPLVGPLTDRKGPQIGRAHV